MLKEGAGSGGAGRGEFLATICRGAFGTHHNHVEPREEKRVGSPRAAIANGSLEARPSPIRPFHNQTVSRFTERSGVGVVFSVFLERGLKGVFERPTSH